MVCVHTSRMSKTPANFATAYRATERARSDAHPLAPKGRRSCDANALNVHVGPARYSGGYVTYARYSPSEYLTSRRGLDTRAA